MSAILAVRLCLMAAVAMLMAGSVAAWTAGAFIKRVGGVMVAGLGALLGAAALGAPEAVLVVGVVTMLAYVAVGVSLLVAVQEQYASAEIADLDAADLSTTPARPPRD